MQDYKWLRYFFDWKFFALAQYASLNEVNGLVCWWLGANVNIRDVDGNTALHYARINSCLETQQALMNAGATHFIGRPTVSNCVNWSILLCVLLWLQYCLSVLNQTFNYSLGAETWAVANISEPEAGYLYNLEREKNNDRLSCIPFTRSNTLLWCNTFGGNRFGLVFYICFHVLCSFHW